MSFHYAREAFEGGRIHKRQGSAKGIPIANILTNPLPIGVTLEILTYVADALTDSHNNNISHGNLSINDIFLGENSVLIDGFGITRDETRAPEGASHGPSTDVYCLGIALLAILSGDASFFPPNDEDHDSTIVQQMISLDWQELQDQPWLEQIQEFLISTLYTNPESRPEALDIANILSGILPFTNGISLLDFIQSHQHLYDFNEPEEEELDEVETLDGPMSFDMNQFDNLSTIPDSAQGAATGLWSRDKIAQIFQEETPEQSDSWSDNLPTEESWNPSAPQHNDFAPPTFETDEEFGIPEPGNIFQTPPNPNEFNDSSSEINQQFQPPPPTFEPDPTTNENPYFKEPPTVADTPEFGITDNQITDPKISANPGIQNQPQNQIRQSQPQQNQPP
ncbi:MAG: hypothetical protein VX278_20850, partial [Myxococcota bacterium]|nr:hypothetical protein [Myxococcota bacterium]